MDAFRAVVKRFATAVLAVGLAAACDASSAAPAGRGRDKAHGQQRHVLVVPIQYPTIQSAIDAAEPGRIVKVLAGTYVEQLVLRKDVRLVGAGMDETVIRAPLALVNGSLGAASIVEILDGAKVSMSHLSVQGPGSHACGRGPSLEWGIRVHSRAHLDLAFSAVRHIHDTPIALCAGKGTAIAVGEPRPGSQPASLNLHHSEISQYQSTGILVLGAGLMGPRHPQQRRRPQAIGQDSHRWDRVCGRGGGTIAHNTIRDNICPADLPQNCGPDFFSQFQHAGIVAGGNGPGTVITHNRLINNQVGMFLAEADEISENIMLDSEFFGLALVGVDDGAFTIKGGQVRGGAGGVWLTPVAMDMTVLLRNVKLLDLSGPAIQVLQGVPFKATVIKRP